MGSRRSSEPQSSDQRLTLAIKAGIAVRVFLSLLFLLVGLLTAREFAGRSNEPTQLMLQGPDIAEQNIVPAKEPLAPVVAITGCEQIWDPTTHMTKEEWAQACRRVEVDAQWP
jgi:hypothetical protein